MGAHEKIPFVEEKTIMQPWRSIQSRNRAQLTDQWFVDTAKIVGPALDAVSPGK